MEERYEPQYQQVSFSLSLNMLFTCIGIGSVVCQSLAYLEQFTFVSAMTWQTQIGHDNIKKLHGTSDMNNMLSNGLRSRHLIIGYVLPAVLSTVTALVELSGPRCASYKPRFGERRV